MRNVHKLPPETRNRTSVKPLAKQLGPELPAKAKFAKYFLPSVALFAGMCAEGKAQADAKSTQDSKPELSAKKQLKLGDDASQANIDEAIGVLDDVQEHVDSMLARNTLNMVVAVAVPSLIIAAVVPVLYLTLKKWGNPFVGGRAQTNKNSEEMEN